MEQGLRHPHALFNANHVCGLLALFAARSPCYATLLMLEFDLFRQLLPYLRFEGVFKFIFNYLTPGAGSIRCEQQLLEVV